MDIALSILDAVCNFMIRQLFGIGVLTIGFIIIVQSVGFNLSSLTILLFGILGVGVGFGLQVITNNVVSGLVSQSRFDRRQ